MNGFPEKTCSVERLVTVPQDVEKVLNGQKTATRRNGVYAYPGEVMVLDGKEFKVDALYAQKLGEMTDEHAQNRRLCKYGRVQTNHSIHACQNALVAHDECMGTRIQSG